MPKDTGYQILINETPDAQATAEAQEIEVVESVYEPSTFRVRFAIDVVNGKLHLAEEPRLLPGKNVPLTVLATVDNATEVLIHGLITDREIELKHGGPGSYLEVRGSDRRVAMARQRHRYKAHSGTVASIVDGVLKDNKFDHRDVESVKGDKYSVDTQTLNQTGSDLDMVNMLAGHVGVAFWVDWTYKGGRIRETAHFASQPPRNEGPGGLGLGALSALPVSLPPLLGGLAGGAPRLTLNTGDPKNTLLSFHATHRTEVPKAGGRVVRVDFDRPTLQKTTIAGPTQPPLGRKLDIPDGLEASVLTAGGADRAHVHGTAALNDASWAIEATAETTLFALGQVVRPRQVVRVEGAGKLDQGDYFVWKVNHTINPAGHRLGIELRRNALGR
jgi:hypothetical protein